MKRFLSYIGLVALLATGCTKKETKETPSEVNQWIDTYLSEWYLWPETLEGRTRKDYLGWEEFFTSLLTVDKEDGKTLDNGSHYYYSYIEREETDAPTKASRADKPLPSISGIAVSAIDFSFDGSNIRFVVRYVVPGTDAAEKLRRGDMIVGVNGVAITENNYLALWNTIRSGTASFSLTWYTAESVYTESATGVITPTVKAENPVLMTKKIALAGQTVGYIVYNSFSSGWPDGDDHRFDDSLKKAFRYLQGVDALVVDLRYNGGGMLTSCHLLASMITSSSGVFCRQEFNWKMSRKGYGGSVSFLPASQMKGEHYGTEEKGVCLGLQKVYVLVSSSSASASELLICSLRGVLGHYNVVVIGGQTEGKAVGMSRINSESNAVKGGTYAEDGTYYKYTMWPVTFKNYNANNDCVPKRGFVPDKEVIEYRYTYLALPPNGIAWKQLGDPREAMLNAALNMIVGEGYSVTSYEGMDLMPSRAAGASVMLELPGQGGSGIRHIPGSINTEE